VPKLRENFENQDFLFVVVVFTENN